MSFQFESLMFIGDPHLTHRGPGSRVDDFAKTSIDKLRQAFVLARAKRARPVITGDLFHRPIEQASLLDALCNLLWEFQELEPCCNVGNHDKREFSLTSGTSLQLIFSTRLLKRLDTDGMTVTLGAQDYHLVGIDHGQELPTKFERPTILVTHHDLAFPGCEYPGTQPIPNIPGVVLGVNGHIHKASEKPLLVGDALWYNPGNILRVSRGELTNQPGVLVWHPETGAQRELLAFRPAAEVFQKLITASSLADGEPEQAPADSSLFATLVAAEGELSAQKTNDGTFLVAVMDKVLDAAEAPPAERQAMAALMRAALAD